MTKRRKYTPKFKAQVVLEIISGAKTQAAIARQHRIKPDLITRNPAGWINKLDRIVISVAESIEGLWVGRIRYNGIG